MAKPAKARKPRRPVELPFAPPNWPAMQVESRMLKDLKPHPKNPKKHSDARVDAMGASIGEFGVTRAIVVDENNMILAGHRQRLAGMKDGIEEMPVFIARGWTEQKKLAFMVADNRHGEGGEYDDTLLRENVSALQLADFNMLAIGYDAPSLLELGIGADPDDDGERGRLLELVNITIDEPKTKVERGDQYVLSGRHTLFCNSVISDWMVWGHALKDGALFCPYPGVFVPFGSKAKAHPLVMVQGDPYIAGHIVDRWIEAHGKKSVRKVVPK